MTTVIKAKKMAIRDHVFLAVVFFYTLYLLFPLLSDSINIPVWLPSISSFGVLLLLYPQAFCNKAVYWFFLYVSVLAIYVIIGKPLTVGIGTIADSKKILIESSYILPPLSLYSVFMYRKSIVLMKKYVLWSIVFLYISFVIVYPLISQYSTLRNALAEQNEELIIRGLPSYSLMHAYVLFLPALCFGYKLTKKFVKVLCFLGISVLCVVINSTSISTCLILMVFVLVFTLFYTSNRSLNEIWAIVLFFVIYFLFESGFFVTLIDMLIPFFEGTPVEGKLIDIQSSIIQREVTGGNLTVRIELHGVSWNSFLQNPLWGTSVVGGHSALIDRFGGMGILVGIPYIMVIISLYKSVLKFLITQTARDFLLLGMAVGFILMFEKGNWAGESWHVYAGIMPFVIVVIESYYK